MRFFVSIKCAVAMESTPDHIREYKLTIPVEAEGHAQAKAKVEQTFAKLMEEKAEADWWDHG